MHSSAPSWLRSTRVSAFFWSLQSGKYDDLEADARRILLEED
jgi:cbb3-type cytochrome oxidase maturation protein